MQKDQKEQITLDVGGTKFYTCKRTLTSTPNVLAKIFNPNSPFSIAKEPLFIDRCPETFKFFLNFLRTGILLPQPFETLIALKCEAQYFDCESLVSLTERRLSAESGM